MAKLGARTQRRGSLGFSDSAGCGTPPPHPALDEDSNSCPYQENIRPAVGLARKRNDSSELRQQT